MSLENYFAKLIKNVETSDAITNQGKDKNGFFKPTRALLLARLNLLKDLHGKPLAKPMLREAWGFVVAHLPPELLVLSDTEKADLKKMLD